MENFCQSAKNLSTEVVRQFHLLKQLDEKVALLTCPHLAQPLA
jgi:hypothetical protein